MELPQEGTHIGHQPQCHRIVAADLLGIDVDMNELRRRDREGITGDPRTRRAIVEAHAERQQHVGLPRGVIGLVVTGARHKAERERMIGIERAHAACGRRDRNLQTLGEPLQFLRGAAIAHALPDQDHRLLGGQQHVDRLHHAVGISAAAARNVGVPGDRVRGFLRRGFHEDVEGDINHDRPRPARHHRLPGLPHRQRHHLAAGRLEHLLAHGAHAGRKVGLIVPVHFLERTAVELAGRHIAGHRHERDGIEIGVCKRDRQVRRARSAGGEGRRRPAGDAVIDVGHEARDALMVHRDGLDLLAALIERVDELDVAVAAEAEDLRHLLLDQVIDNHLGAVEHVACHCRSPRAQPSLLNLESQGGQSEACPPSGARCLMVGTARCAFARPTQLPYAASIALDPISHNTVRQLLL